MLLERDGLPGDEHGDHGDDGVLAVRADNDMHRGAGARGDGGAGQMQQMQDVGEDDEMRRQGQEQRADGDEMLGFLDVREEEVR